MHGSKIVSAAMLPIGMLTEEAQESRNNDYKRYRMSHSRKCNRLSTSQDIFHTTLASSNWLIGCASCTHFSCCFCWLSLPSSSFLQLSWLSLKVVICFPTIVMVAIGCLLCYLRWLPLHDSTSPVAFLNLC